MPVNLASVEPFEICSIRPPTENYSLTFRLTRNCGWNRCTFCPVYKRGALFSRRSIEEVKRDVDRAKVLDDLLTERIGPPPFSRRDIYDDVGSLVAEIRAARAAAGLAAEERRQSTAADDNEDERIKWFSSWFKEIPTLEDSLYHLAAWRAGGGSTCFLGDANSLLLSGAFFKEAVSYVRQAFPNLSRFTVYGRTRSAARKKPEELALFAEAGLSRVHFGLESGSDKVLALVRKGATARDHVEGCRRIREAGISCGVYIMPGLGGTLWSEEHAAETARVLSEAQPDYVRIRSLEIFPGSGLAEAVRKGEFEEATEEEVVREIRTIVERTTAAASIVSDSASNLLDVNGTLPQDRDRMLSLIEDYLSLSPRQKLSYSLTSRLQSFIGQYGGVTPDIMSALAPYLEEEGIDTERMSDEIMARIIKLIRGKLMP